MSHRRASEADRAYLRRVAKGLEPLGDERPPASLEEMFDRLEALERSLGELAKPGLVGEDEAELRSHLRIYERAREIAARGAKRTR